MLRALASPRVSSRSVVTDAATAFPESHRIYEEVSAAAERYEESRAKLQLLIVSLKKQHASMMKTSLKRLETAKQFENFLADTPLSKMVSEVGSDEAKTKVFAHSPPATPKGAKTEKAVDPNASPPPLKEEEEEREDVSSDDSANAVDGDDVASHSSAADAPVKLAEADEASGTKDEEVADTGCEADKGRDDIAAPVASDGRATEEEAEKETGEETKMEVGEEQEEVKEELGAEEEEAKQEVGEEGERQAKPKAAESDEEMAMRLAKEWAEEAEEWKGPPPETEAESRDDAPAIQACDTESTAEESTHSHDDDSSAGPKPPQRPPKTSRSTAHNTDPPVPRSITKQKEADEDESTTSPSQQQKSFAQPLVRDGSDFDEVHHSYGAVHEASHKLTVLYLDQYNSSIIQYVEEWDRAVSTRIHGRLLEFDKQKLKLEHYVTKVDSLRNVLQKKESRNRKVSPKASQRFDRNELKLGGAREAYDSYGESLLLLLEEVTVRAWRDCLPLLMRVMQYDVNYSVDQAKIFSALNETLEMIETLGTGREVDPDGRIQALKDWKPEEIYTGGKHVVPPVHSTRDVYEV